MDIKFDKISFTKDTVLAVPVLKGNKLGKAAEKLDKDSKGALRSAIKNSGFQGKKDEMIRILAPTLPVAQVILFTFPADGKSPEKALKATGGNLYSYINRHKIKSATLLVEEGSGKKQTADEAAALIALGAKLKSYCFDKYFTTKKPEEKPQLQKLSLLSGNPAKAKAYYAKECAPVVESVFLTRDLVSEPPNVLYPESYAGRVKELKKIGLEIEVLDVKAMAKLGMGALLGVGQGSRRDSRLVVMKWNGGKKGAKPLAFVGKGVTFDTGGISIKPANGMDEMKYDMAGSGAVVGLLSLLARRKAKVNVVGVIGLVENMPDGNAQRPGDVVTSMSGQTIEVLNTDAEGRLVLADALWYTQSKYKPQFIINLATLTGAILVALGSSKAGLFSNNDQLAENLFKTGEKTGEELWRLPLGDYYDKQINSDIADMQNIGADREAGSITAAVFLQRFVNNVPWAHLDIAGTAWTKKGAATIPKGATAYGVQLLDQLVRDFYE